MAFSHGKYTKVAYGGYNLTLFFNEASSSNSVETASTSAFGTTAHSYVIGLVDGTISVSGMFDGSVGAVDEALQTRMGVEDQLVLVLPGGDGTGVGARAIFGQVENTSYEITSPTGDVVAISAEFQGDGGVHHGTYLREAGGTGTFETITAGGAAVTDTGPAHNDGAASSGGGLGQVHVANNDLSVAATIKIQHSTDNISWVDLVTFASVAAGAETAEQVSVTGTVNQYLRSVVSVPIGTGSAEVAVAFKRN